MDNPPCDNLRQMKTRIQETCRRTGRDPSEILLVAVSKTKPNSAIEEVFECGQRHFGENRARELQGKMSQIHHNGIIWHFVGPLQTNKIKYMVERVDWIHSVYKKKYLNEIEKRAREAGRSIQILIQINISGEGQKQGCKPEAVSDLLKHAQSMDCLRIRGVMGMATFTGDKDLIRGEFKLLKEVFDSHQHLNGGAVRLDHISMGMTNDFEIAIEEGSTMIRVGTAIFGEREYH